MVIFCGIRGRLVRTVCLPLREEGVMDSRWGGGFDFVDGFGGTLLLKGIRRSKRRAIGGSLALFRGANLGILIGSITMQARRIRLQS